MHLFYAISVSVYDLCIPRNSISSQRRVKLPDQENSLTGLYIKGEGDAPWTCWIRGPQTSVLSPASPSSTERKMTRLLVLVLACGALLISTETQQDYHRVPDHYKEAIKLAVKNAHQSTSQHMNFHNIYKDPKTSSEYIDIEFLLRATNCAKSAVPDHRDDCVFVTNRPFINCRVCSKRSGNDLKDPSIDCAPQQKVDEDKRLKMCHPEHLDGVITPLSSTDTKEADGDCLGCF